MLESLETDSCVAGATWQSVLRPGDAAASDHTRLGPRRGRILDPDGFQGAREWRCLPGGGGASFEGGRCLKVCRGGNPGAQGGGAMAPSRHSLDPAARLAGGLADESVTGS